MATSIRHNILQALDAKGALSLAEIQQAIGEESRKRALDNANEAVTDGLVIRKRDVVTGSLRASYQITAAGRKRLAEGVQSRGGEAAMKTAKQRKVAAPTTETVHAPDPVQETAAPVMAMESDVLEGETARKSFLVIPNWEGMRWCATEEEARAAAETLLERIGDSDIQSALVLRGIGRVTRTVTVTVTWQEGAA